MIASNANLARQICQARQVTLQNLIFDVAAQHHGQDKAKVAADQESKVETLELLSDGDIMIWSNQRFTRMSKVQ